VVIGYPYTSGYWSLGLSAIKSMLVTKDMSVKDKNRNILLV